MGNKHKAIFVAFGILILVTLILYLTDVQAHITSSAKTYSDSSNVNGNSLTKGSKKEQNMSDALYMQKTALRNVIDNGKYIPDYFLNYDIVYFNKFNDERYKVGIQGEADFVTMISHEELYDFNIEKAALKAHENIDLMLNMTKDSLNGLLAKKTNLPDVLDDYSIVYYKDLRQGEYELGIEAKGKQYYFLLENYSRFTPQGRWAVLGWSEGNVPDDWNDVLAMQHYVSIIRCKFSEQEYEKFFVSYVDDIYKLMDEKSKLLYDMEKIRDGTFDDKHYNLVAANGISIYQEALKVMKIEAPDKYKASHDMLVKAMYRVIRIASVHLKGNEGYKDETNYNNNWGYDLRAIGSWDIINKAYACFEVQKRNETFDEYKYNEIEYENRVEITRLIDKQINKYTNFTLRHAYSGVTKLIIRNSDTVKMEVMRQIKKDSAAHLKRIRMEIG